MQIFLRIPPEKPKPTKDFLYTQSFGSSKLMLIYNETTLSKSCHHFKFSKQQVELFWWCSFKNLPIKSFLKQHIISDFKQIYHCMIKVHFYKKGAKKLQLHEICRKTQVDFIGSNSIIYVLLIGSNGYMIYPFDPINNT